MDNEMSSYFEDPEFKELLAQYEGMVENHTPTYFEADELIAIAEYYAVKGRNEDADKAIELALQLHPGDTDTLIFRARSLMLLGKKEEAKKVMQVIGNTADREFRFLQADLLMEEGHMEEADELLQQLATDEEYELDTLLDIILAYNGVNQKEYAGKWIECLSSHYDIHDLEKTNQRLRDIMCDYYSIVLNQPGRAIPYLKTTLNESPYSIQHWNELGKCYLLEGEYEKAHEALDFALAIDENNEETLSLKAFVYNKSGNFEEAVKCYLHLEEVTEDKVTAYMSLAAIYLDTKNYQSALKYAQKALDQKSEFNTFELNDIYGIAAICHAALGCPEKGYEYMDQVLEQNGNDVDVRINAGLFYTIIAENKDFEEEKERNLSKADEHFKLALDLTPKEERMDTLFKIGGRYFDEGLYDYANRYFEQINEEFPKTAYLTYIFLLYGYYYLQNSDGFMHYLAKMKKEMPETYENMGIVDDAQIPDKHFNEALRLIKENISAEKIDLNKYL